MTEADLPALGVHRIPVPVPFRQAGGPANVYVLEEAEGGLTLWDSGLGSEQAEAALEEGFERLGRRIGEVSRIIVSHGHVDHFGAARFVQERSGREVPVYAHPADVPKIAESGRRWRELVDDYAAHLVRLGVPPDVLAEVGREGEHGFRLSRRVREVRPIGEGDMLKMRRLALRVLHMPGHTPGLVCLQDADSRLFFASDHLLEKVSPNPIIELGPNGEDGFFQPLVAYLESIRRTRALDIGLVLPGHGEPFSGHREVIDRLLEFYAKRQARIVELLRAGATTVFEVARALFASARPGDTFLTISETIANIEVLERSGAVSRDASGAVYRFRAV